MLLRFLPGVQRRKICWGQHFKNEPGIGFYLRIIIARIYYMWTVCWVLCQSVDSISNPHCCDM